MALKAATVCEVWSSLQSQAALLLRTMTVSCAAPPSPSLRAAPAASEECRVWGARHAADRPVAVILTLFLPQESERDRWTPVSVPPFRRWTLRKKLCFPPLVRLLFYAVYAAQVRARIRVTFWGDVTTDSVENTDKFTFVALSKARPHRFTQYKGMFWNKEYTLFNSAFRKRQQNTYICWIQISPNLIDFAVDDTQCFEVNVLGDAGRDTLWSWTFPYIDFVTVTWIFSHKHYLSAKTFCLQRSQRFRWTHGLKVYVFAMKRFVMT